MPAKLTQEKFIEKAILKHEGKYNYSLVEYTKANNKVKILCPKHGVFEQQPNNHLFGQGCIWCMGDNVRNARKFTKEQWIEKFKLVHGDRYDYSNLKIGIGAGSEYKIIIICKKHGEFLQVPNAHLHLGCGCPYCNISKGEDEIEKYLIKNDIEYLREYRFNDCVNPKTNRKLPFDFYLPKNNLLIEYQGEQHFKKMGDYFENKNGGLKSRQERDLIKNQYCLNKNIKLLEISYLDFNNINKILKEKI
jgi:hypothetical protein